MARDLETDVCKFERTAAVAAARVLRADKFLEDIEVRGLETRAEAEAHILRESADLWDDPAQDVSRKDDGRGFFKTGFSAAGAFGAGGEGHDALRGVGHLACGHRAGWSRRKEEEG